MPPSRTTDTVGSKRLMELDRVPTFYDIESLLMQGLQSYHRVQLPWVYGKPPEKFALGISVSRDPDDATPRWAFYRGWEADAHIEWAYATQDIALIHNMLLCSFADEVLTPEAHSSYAYVPSLSSSVSGTGAAGGNGSGTTGGMHEASGSRADEYSLHPATESEHRRESPVLQGSLQKLQIDALLQSLGASGLTGKLRLRFHDLCGEIFLEDGTLVHCQLEGVSGQDPLLELLSWRVGDFEFIADEKAPHHTITRSLQSLLLESATLKDYELFLTQSGVNAESILFPKVRIGNDPNQFKEVPLDPTLLKSFIGLLDDQHCLAEVYDRLKLPKSHWLPVVYNLVKHDLVRVRPKRAAIGASPMIVDPFILQAVRSNLINANTGFYSYGALLFFIEQELVRHQDHGRPFAVILLLLKKDRNDNVAPGALLNKLRSIKNVLRPCDQLCHFENSGFGIMLPETDDRQAGVVVRKIMTELSHVHPSDAELPTIGMKIGSASIPNDCTSMGLLLSLPLTPEHCSLLILGRRS